MGMTVHRKHLERILSEADIAIDGERSWDLRVHDPRLFREVLARGSLGLGEAYMDGWWDCDAIDELCCRLVRNGIDRTVRPLGDVLSVLRARLMNLQSVHRAFEVGRRHYDVGNDLYSRMLGERMVYSCAYWKDAQDLDAAQDAKLDLVCRKLRLEPGMTVLDVGCGWGGALEFAARHYGIKGVGITISTRQAEYAREKCSDLPVEIRLQDYRLTQGKFDRILSIGMMEHVGRKNYETYFSKMRSLLKDDGLFLLHTIGSSVSASSIDRWIGKYIFPNAMIPSAKQLAHASEGKLIMEDWHAFGTDYDTTLMNWFERFSDSWHEINSRYDERFYRMWKFYLLSCAGVFRSRDKHVWQILYSVQGLPEGFAVPR